MKSKIETTNELRDDKVLRLVIKYSIPAILAMMVTSLYNTVDRAFIGSMKDVGALAISGLGVTMPFMTILGAFCVGLAVGGSTNIAIKLGEGNKEEAEKALGNTFAIELFVGIAMMIISAFFLEDILYFFGASSDTIKYSMDYMSVIMCGAWFNLPGFAMNSAIRGEGNPKLASKMMITSCLLNLILDPIFIFGFGMGIKGAALATVIARIVEFILIISYVYFIKKDYILKFNLKDFKLIDKDFINTFISKTLPVFINDTTWAIGTILYSVAYSQAGTSAIAASQIATSTGNFFIITSVCIGIGASIMLGNELGADRIDTAIIYAKKFSKLVVIVGLICGGLLILNIPILLKMFSVSSDLAPDMTKIFFIMGIMLALRAFNTLIVIGILRSGGDTKYSLYLELGCMWFASIPLTFVAAFKGAPIYILVLLSYSEEIVKFIFGVPRALSKKWANNIVKEMN